MSTEVRVRTSRADDPRVRELLGELDAYLASLYAPEHNYILDEAALLAPEVTLLAAWSGDEVLGCCAFRREAGYGEVKRMVVRPAHRGSDVARRLLAALEATMRDAGIGLARLETGRDQLAAVRFYEREGYERCAAFGGYPDNGLSVFYQKQLL